MKEDIKTNDWCYYEYQLCQVKEIDHRARLTLSDGYLEMSNIRPEECWPQTMRIKHISDECQRLYNSIRNSAGNLNINYPDIHRCVVNYFNSLCAYQDNDTLQLETWANLTEFVADTCQKIQEIQEIQIGEIKLLKQ